jgi:hypothetical protein
LTVGFEDFIAAFAASSYVCCALTPVIPGIRISLPLLASRHTLRRINLSQRVAAARLLLAQTAPSNCAKRMTDYLRA